MSGFALACLLFVASVFAEDATTVNEFDGLDFSNESTSDDDDRSGPKEVMFFLFTKQRVNNPEILTTSHARFRGYSSFVPRRPTKVIIHGWRGHESSKFDIGLKNAYLPVFDYNVIVVDWAHHGSSSMNYISARNNVDEVAGHVADFLMGLCRQFGVKLESIHVLGHSLGAHIAGLAGTKVRGGKFGRVTGLDPAGPMFDPKDGSKRLSTNSANFVDVIHTCGYLLGMRTPIGHADFYPNGGHIFQPGCGADVTGHCSHSRSYIYYAETILTSKAFPAVSCNDWDSYKGRKCNFQNIAVMGEAVPWNARGSFFLRTRDKGPFGTYSV